MAPLLPLIQRRGLQTIELPADNYELAAYKGLLIKGSYWRWTRGISGARQPSVDGAVIPRVWPERELAGNAIDFFVKILGLSFNDAMREITGP